MNVVNTPPTITAIANQIINANTTTGALAFTVGDAQTAANLLTVTGSSSNTTLVPAANIVFSGTGASRTVTVTPAASQSGSATITLTVSDGTLTASTAFTLTVLALTSQQPVDLYHFDEDTGTTVHDSAGSNPGTLVGSPLPVWVSPGPVGVSALSFSGNGVYNQSPAESAVQLTSDLSPILGGTSSLMAWINTTQTGNNTHYQAPAITGVEQSGAGNDINWGYLDGSGHIGIAVGDSGSLLSTSPVNDGQWHNIAITRDAGTGIVNLYVDGVLNGSSTLGTGALTSRFSLIGALSVVASDGVTFTGANYFNGQIDEVRIYNRVLTAQDVDYYQALWTATGTGSALNWSNNPNWASAEAPESGANTTLTWFAGSTLPTGAITSSNDVATPFVLNALTLSGTGPAGAAATVTITGGALSLAASGNGAAPVVNLSANQGSGVGAALTYAAGVPVILGTSTIFQGSGNATFTFAAPLSGAGGLTKTGSSTLILAGTSSFGGPTIVSGGVLAVNGSFVTGSGLTIGAAGTLAGSGTIGSVVVISGTHSPGTGIGRQTFTAGLTYGATSHLSWGLTGNTATGAGVNFDTVSAAGVTVQTGRRVRPGAQRRWQRS